MRILGAIILSVLLTGSAQGQSTDLKIDAGSGIAWVQDQKYYLASGRVRIIRGRMTAWSDIARAYYDDDPGVVTRIELERNVRFLQDKVQIEGDFAKIFPDEEDIKVSGERPRLESDGVVITARDFLRFHGKNNRVFAEGDALLTEGASKVAAQRMEGVLIGDQDSGDLELKEAFFLQNVRMDNGHENPEERLYVEGEEGYFNRLKSWMRVCKEARVQRGDDVMRGACAHYDVETKNFAFLQNIDLTKPLPEHELIPTPHETAPKPNQDRSQLILKTKN